MYAKPRAATVVARTEGVLWRLGRAGFRMVQAHAAPSEDHAKARRHVAAL